MKFEYRVYYDADGKIITYTTEKIPGNFILVTADEYMQCRHDAIVVDGQLVYTHITKHVMKLTKNKDTGIACNKYDVSVISDDDEYEFFTVRAYAIK